MAKRRTSSPSTWAWVAAVIVATLVGGGLGLRLAYDRVRPSSFPPTPPVAITTPAPPRTTPTPTSTALNDEALDSAVRRAVGRIGPILRTETEERSIQEGADQVVWLRRTLKVRVDRSSEEAAAFLRAEVEGAGGQVIAKTPSGLEVGVLRRGQPLVTHEIRFVRYPAGAHAVIIFDDAGGSLADLEPVLALGRPVTVSVLPGLRYSREVATRAQAAGLEVFLHLPVEPEDPRFNLGPGGVTTAMSEGEILTTVQVDLAWVPGAEGLNNHMGSRGTADPRLMRAILTVAKERGLIFIDSLTSPHSIAAEVATEMNIPTATRDMFLDNVNEAAAIREQIRRLIALAKRRGTAVAIGHTPRLTARILLEMLPEFDQQGVDIVSVATVVH